MHAGIKTQVEVGVSRQLWSAGYPQSKWPYRPLSPFWWRVLEILPGALTWVALLGTVILSYSHPVLVAVFVICFDLNWLFRSIRMTSNTIRTYRYIKRDRRIDWSSRLRQLTETKITGTELVVSRIKPDELYHAIILVHYKEPLELLIGSIESYARSQTNKERLWLVLASEARAGEEIHDIYRKINERFKNEFGQIIQTIHPADIEGEIKCKSANGTWAAKELKKVLDDRRIGYDEVLVHNFDADTKVYPNYFDYIAYQYLMCPLGQPTSFQPVHVYANNIWEVPALMRLIAQSSTLIFMHNMLRQQRFHHFSSRSDVFQTIVDINYWTVNAIPEDSRQYYDSYFHYHGQLVVKPIYIPLRMDAVYAKGYWPTVQNQYYQLRRWAWGISDLPYVVNLAIKDRAIGWYEKLSKILQLLESHFSWATSAIFITIIGWLPRIFNTDFTNTVFGYNFPAVTRTILGLALVGLITGIVISFLLLPPRPEHRHKWYYVNFIWQWILAPIASVFLSSFAAIDAQTRLMIGKRLDYQVTEKAVARNR